MLTWPFISVAEADTFDREWKEKTRSVRYACECLTTSVTMEPLIKDTLKEDKPLNKGQSKSTFVYTLYTK